ncbi:MAG: methyltransferase domain-containing protein [Acidimicrobiales bacterium]|nr:methyltransferase domain-containing protein [Acidimicrobiales bacterium]
MKYLPPRYLFRRYEVLRNLQPGERFLEIGAGDLTLSLELLEHFKQGVAIELTDDMHVVHAALPDDARERLTPITGDFATIDLDGQFDAVISCEVLEHVLEHEEFLRRMNSVLRPGGQLILAVPSRMKYWTEHDELVGHVRRYEKDDIRGLLEQAGFVGVRILSYGFPWVNMLRIPRRILARHQRTERSQWDLDTRTQQSNHRQIPEALSQSPLRFFTRPTLFQPFAAISRLFNSYDLSDGYVVVTMRPPCP